MQPKEEAFLGKNTTVNTAQGRSTLRGRGAGIGRKPISVKWIDFKQLLNLAWISE